jgi:iron complex outermembrane receptor protein
MYALPVSAENRILEEITVRSEKESPMEESLTIREVRESPARDMGEALKHVEGVSYVRKGAIANDLVLRGFQKDNINVLVDGVRIHGACPARMDPPSFHYDFAEVEEVKVVKGPYDLTNPGGLGGMVDARTKKADKGLGGDLSLTYGSYDSVNTSATGSYGTDKYDALLGYAYKYSGVPKSGDGKLITDIYPSSSPSRYRPDTVDSKAYEINTGWVKFGVNPTADSRSDISYTYQDAEHVLYPYLKMDADSDLTHRLNWTYSIRKLSPLVTDLKLQAYWNRVKHLMDDRWRVSSNPSMMVTRPYSMQTDAKTQVAGAKVNASFAVGPGSLKSGIDYYNRSWDAVNRRAMYKGYADNAMIPDVYIDNLGIFSEYELPLGSRFTLKGGLRGDLTWAEATKSNTLVTSGTDADFGEISANLQLTHTPFPGLEIFTGIARGTRPPDPQELYLDVPAMSPAVSWRGNPNLKPTVNHQADIGAKYSNNRFYVSASLFYSDLQDYVNFYQASPTLKSYQNIHATMWGAELGSQVSLPRNLFLRGSLSYSEGENESGNRPLSEIPPLKGTISARYDNGVFFVEVLENLASKQDRIDAGLNEQVTPGWATTDLKGGYDYKGLSVFAGINNLFDKQYFTHLSYVRDPFAGGVGYKVPENGRNFYITLACKF